MADEQPQIPAPRTTGPMTFLWVVFAVVGLGLVGYYGFRPSAGSGGKPVPRQTAPDFTLPAADGSTVTLATFKGKPVFINFWATWCGPCLQELPMLAKMQQAHKGDMQFLFISIDNNWDVVNRYLKASKLQIPVVLDKGSKVAMAFGANAWPTTITLDKDLGIIRKVEGSLDETLAKEIVDEALGTTPTDSSTAPR